MYSSTASMKKIALAGVLAMCASVALADFPLYVPGFDDQPLTADVEGVDAQGHTTYRLGPGTMRSSGDDAGLIGSATLVEGPSDAHLVYINTMLSLSLSEDCAINSGIAVCTVNASGEGSSSVDVETETASAITVQGNAATFTTTSSPAATSSPTGASSSAGTSGTSAATAGSSPSSGPSSTDSSTSTSASPTGGNGNGAGRVEVSGLFSLGLVSLLAVFFL